MFHLLTQGYAGVFSLRDITRGRIDEVARFIHNSLFLSHDLRRDTVARVTMFEGPLSPLTVEISGREVRGLHPDERSIAGFLRRAIEIHINGGAQLPGIKVVDGFVKDGSGVVLDERGKMGNPRTGYFYIGGPKGFPLDLDLPKVSLGGLVYTASQAVTIVNYLLDVGRWTTE